ncbi:thiopeptide-type bacteriocin biosynthesis protein [Tumebacillus sp. BK434]|uniref:lantibiotic dehydratase n=1 Tax=Tumebacillus sp. BK434 TaxID=2512169 RepID=UPI00104C6B1C|nr:lantibiotic dehydratase [Tumebacillus sp. BK434]TCP55550.1 thiopeptide-type bacteriocin biosynthesis protein [Tumebacillus sp. BK434]
MNETSWGNAGRYGLADFYLVRANVFPVEVWENTVKAADLYRAFEEKPVLEALAAASPSLYDSLSCLSQEIKPRKRSQIENSLLRYLIRMTTRPTPYGLFAGVAVGGYREQAAFQFSQLDSYQKHARPDMEWTLRLIRELESRPELIRQLRVQTNPAVYLAGNKIRLPYVNRYGRAEQHHALMRSSLHRSQTVEFALQEAGEPIAFETLTERIAARFTQANLKEVRRFLEDLLQREYLISELRSSLSNKHPFTRLMDLLVSLEGIDEITEKLAAVSRDLASYHHIPMGTGTATYLELSKSMKDLADVKHPLQVDVMLNGCEVALPGSIKKELEAAAEIIWRLSCRQVGNPHLQGFRNDFLERYGRDREVPLLELLDDEVGLGSPALYKFPAGHREYDPKPATQSRMRETYVTTLAMQAVAKRQLEVELTDDTLANLESVPPKFAHSPLSMELYASVEAQSVEALNSGDYLIWLNENSGSFGAGKSFGRFSLTEQLNLQEQFLQIHQAEQSHRPEAIFAEVIFLPCTDRDANLTITQASRDFQILLGVFHSDQDQRVISLEDLLVGCTGEFFYLKSRSLNREVIPVTNHMLNLVGVPNVYRFLLELATERSKQWEPMNWGNMKQAPFLPRLRYKRIVIAPAQWRLSKFSNLQTWREEWKVPRYLYLVEEDQRMMLDLDNELHFALLQNAFNKLTEHQYLTLTECCYDPQGSWCQGPVGRHATEFVFPFLKKADAAAVTEARELRWGTYLPDCEIKDRTFFTGSEWLYAKLYIPHRQQNEFLRKHLKAFCEQALSKALFEEFYYIRFDEPEPHLRLRFHGQSSLLVHQLIPLLAQWASTLQQKGILLRLSYDTYEREIERFGGLEAVESAEKIFAADSRLAVFLHDFSSKNSKSADLETLGVFSVLDMMTCFFPDRNDQLSWLESIVTMKPSREGYAKKRSQLIRLAEEKEDWIHGEIARIMEERRNKIFDYRKVIVRLGNETFLERVAETFLHLHINRLIGGGDKEAQLLALALRVLRELTLRQG